MPYIFLNYCSGYMFCSAIFVWSITYVKMLFDLFFSHICHTEYQDNLSSN